MFMRGKIIMNKFFNRQSFKKKNYKTYVIVKYEYLNIYDVKLFKKIKKLGVYGSI